MSAKLCLLLVAILGSLEVPVIAIPLSVPREALSEYTGHLEKLATGLAAKLDELSMRIENGIQISNAELMSQLSDLEKSWGEKIDCAAIETIQEKCSDQIDRLFELLSSLSSATTQCGSEYRQKLLDLQLSSRRFSTSIKDATTKLGISVSCVEENGGPPKCVVSTEPLSALAKLLGEAAQVVGAPAAQEADAYGAHIKSCWKQSSTTAPSLAHEIIQDIAQCANAKS